MASSSLSSDGLGPLACSRFRINQKIKFHGEMVGLPARVMDAFARPLPTQNTKVENHTHISRLEWDSNPRF
jgi:hypothetical protein